MTAIFFRLLDQENKATLLRACVGATNHPMRFQRDLDRLSAIPTSPFVYWLSDSVVRAFDLHRSVSEHEVEAMVGAATTDDFRFIRAAWEVSRGSVSSDPRQHVASRWMPFAKGGRYSKYYSDIHLVLDWALDAQALKARISEYRGSRGWGYQWSANLNGYDCYFRPGITWPRRSNRLSFRILAAGCIFGNKGPAAFVRGNDSQILLALTAHLNSTAFASLLGLDRADATIAQSFEVGRIQLTPIPEQVLKCGTGELPELARRAWSHKRSLDAKSETSHAFTLPALLQVAGASLSDRATAWTARVSSLEAELTAIQAEIDDRCFALYGIDEVDRGAITGGFGSNTTELESSGDGADDDPGEDADETEYTADLTGLAAELVSWAVGVAFGRFDVQLATGARPIPTEPEPFDPLPTCSPGMLTDGDGLPLARQPAGYPLAFPATGMLVDDLGQAEDLPTAVRAVFDVVFGAGADRWWDNVATLLDPKSRDLRAWLAGSCFEHHLKRHSKSRRKAPIVWQLGTPSGRYSVWLYAHRLTRDSFFQLQNEVVGPKLIHEERQLTNLMQNAGGSPSASERKQIAAQEAFVEELRAMLDEVKRVAPLWNPNLDDGVLLTMAPLWRLVPQHKAWQKELKSKWTELAAGKYDWAHLAMHLWPERVVPKCAIDRSLAIAHGLEDAFWIEGAEGKWKPQSVATSSVEALVRERTSSAVKAALKRILDAPAAAGVGHGGGRHAATATADRTRF